MLKESKRLRQCLEGKARSEDSAGASAAPVETANPQPRRVPVAIALEQPRK